MRQCPKCKELKKLTTENFYRNKSEVGGFQYTCKVCHKNHYKRKAWGSGNNKEYKNKRYHNDPEFRLLVNLRNRINQYLKKGDHQKSISFLGCSIAEWKLHLENKFTNQMNWDNYGTYWEIDHTIPLSKSGSFHYTNTSPMTITENRQKSNKL